MHPKVFILAAALMILAGAKAAPLSIQGPGVKAADFRITTFATGLNYPLGMAQLSDGSLLAAVSSGTSLFGTSTGQVIRLVDANQDGIADGPPTVLYTGLPGGQTALRIGGPLVFVTGQGRGIPISILRLGASPGDPLTLEGKINITYPSGGWRHPHSALAVRPTPGASGSYELFFQLGSEMNFARTTRTATLDSEQIGGLSGTLTGDSIYRVTIRDQTTNVIASNLIRIARGLRNAAGFAFHPVTGDLYFEENGIDGLVDANEPTSADELNWIPDAEIGGATVENFGFPDTYTVYRTGRVVGDLGRQPLVAFQPIPDPFTGSESEGPNDIAFAPRSFPEGLNNGIFVGFHGKYNAGGVTNEENPLVYVDLATLSYFHFIGADEPDIGHLDGLLATDDSLFVADLASNGSLSKGAGLGVIYQIKSLSRPSFSFARIKNALELEWTHGTLQKAASISGPWDDVRDPIRPYLVNPEHSAAFFRIRN